MVVLGGGGVLMNEVPLYMYLHRSSSEGVIFDPKELLGRSQGLTGVPHSQGDALP